MIGHNGGPLREGWIARHRSVRDHWLVGHGKTVKPADPSIKHCLNKGEAWEDMCMECRYEAATINNGGKKMELRRGEMLGAVSWLAARWNWTPKTVRGFLDDLENDGMIEMRNPALEKGNQKGRQANVIRACNYDIYQSGHAEAGQPEGQPQGDQRATRGRPEGNIYKDNKGTREQGNKEENIPPTPKPPPGPSPDSVGVSLREGEVEFPNGVFVNCETIRHQEFTISLAGIDMQLLGTVPMAEIKSVATGHALQWAIDLAAGKRNVVPSNPASFIRGSIQNQRNNGAVLEVRKTKAAAPKESTSDKYKRIFEAVAAEKAGR